MQVERGREHEAISAGFGIQFGPRGIKGDVVMRFQSFEMGWSVIEKWRQKSLEWFGNVRLGLGKADRKECS